MSEIDADLLKALPIEPDISEDDCGGLPRRL